MSSEIAETPSVFRRVFSAFPKSPISEEAFGTTEIHSPQLLTCYLLVAAWANFPVEEIVILGRGFARKSGFNPDAPMGLSKVTLTL